MTLNVLEGHSPIASLFKCDISFFMACCAVPLHLRSFLYLTEFHVNILFYFTGAGAEEAWG